MHYRTFEIIAAADPDVASALLQELPSAKRLRFAKRLGNPTIFAAACSTHHAGTIAREADAFGVPSLGLVLAIAVRHHNRAVDVAKELRLSPELIAGIQPGGTFRLDSSSTQPISPPGPIDDLFQLPPPRLGPPELPDNLHIPGDLVLSGWDGNLPEGLKVDGTLTLRSMPNLSRFPAGTSVGLGLEIVNCPALTAIGTLRRDGHSRSSLFPMRISGCPKLETISSPSQPITELTLFDLPSLQRMPAVEVEDLHIEKCRSLRSLDGIQVRGEVVLYDCGELSCLPTTWNRLTGLSITRCDSLKTLPESLKDISGDLVVPKAICCPTGKVVTAASTKYP